jgi:hypothetical protein
MGVAYKLPVWAATDSGSDQQSQFASQFADALSSRFSEWEPVLDADVPAPPVRPTLMVQSLSNLSLALSSENVPSQGRSRRPLARSEPARKLRNFSCQRGDNCKMLPCPPTGDCPTFDLCSAFAGFI